MPISINITQGRHQTRVCAFFGKIMYVTFSSNHNVTSKGGDFSVLVKQVLQ